jgi:DNA-binding transcriptional ArsR family regulator
VGELAAATALAPGYVSRLLEALDDDALVERSKRGRVEAVEIAALLRRWAEDYDLLATNQAETFLAPRGAQQTLEALGGLPDSAEVVVTGSFAAVRLAPVAAPALLAAYSNDPGALARELGLIPADQGSNVVLLRPFDEVVWRRTDAQDGIRYAAPSQAAVDCLTGNGRMPAEGEATLAWMLANEATWRRGSLGAVTT